MNGVSPGFAEGVADSQLAFRALLAAMSCAGTVVELAAPAPPPGLSAAAAAVALTLCDPETPVWLAGSTVGAAEWLRFHCGAPITGDPAASRFAFAAEASALPPLDCFALGTDAYPDRSTTLVLEVSELRAGDGSRLRGPGIADEVRLVVGGIGDPFWQARRSLARLFPRGLDIILTCGKAAAALPRTVVTEG
jgi:alpha-D-ribose 1-methylphosphonate 5-triphosphate synthase subunit PhnH